MNRRALAFAAGLLVGWWGGRVTWDNAYAAGWGAADRHAALTAATRHAPARLSRAWHEPC